MTRLTHLRALACGLFLAGVLAGVLTGAASAQDFDLDREINSAATQGCAANVSPPAPNSRAAADAVKVLPPASGAYVGAYQIPAQAGEVARFANATGAVPPIVFSFHDFFAETNNGTTPDKRFSDRMEGGQGSVPPLELAEWLSRQGSGSVLALAWAIYCCDVESTGFWFRLKKPHDHINRVLAGRHDDSLREAARQIKAFGKPIILTVVPEMNWQGQFLFGADGRRWMDAVDNLCNAYGDPAWPDGPERVRDVFIHVIDLFRAEGVKNVTWMMYASNGYMVPGGRFEGQSRWLHPQYYYPGDAYIDWIGQSVYFTAAEWAGQWDEMGTFEQVFLPGYEAWRSVTNKPMMMPEFGILTKGNADRRALWQDLLTRQLKSVPGVKSVTIADSPVFREYFDIPLLSTDLEEVNVVSQILRGDGYYRNTLRTGRPN